MMQSNLLVIGQKYKTILNNCENLNNKILWIPDNPFVDRRLAGHADLSIFYHRGVIYAAKYLESCLKLRNCIFLDDFIGEKYPFDVKFNACSLGDTVILNESTVSHKIFDIVKGEGSRIISVKQGYTKCNTLVLNDNTIITSDSGIEITARSNNLNVLKISEGSVTLEGFPYGFIGGCGFMYNSNTLVLTGTLKRHPDEDRIIDFCRNLDISIEYLTDNDIFDIGGIIKAE